MNAANDNRAGREDADKARVSRACPICGRPASQKMRPFCSKRCADVDLHRWLGGRYALPAGNDQDPAGSEDE